MGDRVRGSHGASLESLDNQFVKCKACSIKIPIEDVERYKACQKCPFNFQKDCPFEATADDISGLSLVGVQPSASVAKPKQIKQNDKDLKRRWVKMTAKGGNVYYHNTETGKDVWEKPGDYEELVPASDGMIKFGDRTKDILVAAQDQKQVNQLGLNIQVQPSDSLSDGLTNLKEQLKKNEQLAAQSQADQAAAAPEVISEGERRDSSSQCVVN